MSRMLRALIPMASLAALAAPLAHAQTLPATPPTTQAAPAAPVAAAPAPAATPVLAHGKHADVRYTDGLLAVNADNSSLNVILRQIAAATGMKITGGVADERVFGSYGPAYPSEVLATLLGGTGVNILLKQTVTNAPAELILTPRTGSATPPGPNSPQYDEEARAEASQPPAPAAVPTPQASAIPVATLQPAHPAGATPPPAATQPATTTVTSPNGVKTPQQIYEQLMQMQKTPQAGAAPHP